MTSKELDNCPFCGSEHILEALQKPVGASEYFMIKCFDCSAEITRTSRRKAVAAWNRRDGKATVNHNKLWCEEYEDYYGNSDPKYGGTLTDLRKLPVGTEFEVANGWWKGKILSDNSMLIYRTNSIVELTDNHHSYYLK